MRGLVDAATAAHRPKEEWSVSLSLLVRASRVLICSATTSRTTIRPRPRWRRRACPSGRGSRGAGRAVLAVQERAPMLGCVLDEDEPPVARPSGGCEVFADQVADPQNVPRDRRRTLWSEVGGRVGDRQLGALADAPAAHQGQDVSETAVGLPRDGGRSRLI